MGTCEIFGPTEEVLVGHLKRDSRKILDVLQNELSLQLFVDQSVHHRMQPLGELPKASKRVTRGQPKTCVELYIVLYGPPSTFEDVGIFTAKCNLFLQHPRYCDRNVPYRNPQCLSRKDDNIVFTYDMTSGPATADFFTDTLANPIDLFADIAGQEGLAEADSPLALSTQLYKHQKQALTFMLQREGGWALDGHHRDIWKAEREVTGRLTYINIVTSRRNNQPPPPFRGGLLIDAPGLGKSLSIIALIAAHRRVTSNVGHGKGANTTTLLIVPKTRKG